jgi:peptide/nickel transport system permease protein
MVHLGSYLYEESSIVVHFLRRILFYLGALWAAVTFNFLLPRMMPGNPVDKLYASAQGKINLDQLPAIRAAYGISHDPLWKQYFDYLGNTLRGDFGISLSNYPSPVMDVVQTGIIWTLGMAGVTTLLSFALGTLMGIIAAWNRGSFFERALPPLLIFIQSMPYYFMALILLYFLAFKWNVFPLSGGYGIDYAGEPISFDTIMDMLDHAILPALTILLVSIGGWMLGMRNNMLNTLAEDYVLLAEANGIPQRRIMFGYASRNAILPSITGLAIALGFVVSGQLLTEQVFNYPGIGLKLFAAIGAYDYPLMQALFLFISLGVLLANFLADIVFAILDPRVRDEGA